MERPSEESPTDQKLENHENKSQSKSLLKSTSPSQEDITSKLTGRTLMAYFVLLNKGSIGVRELQRHLGLSSPSVSRYHLDKLVELQLVENHNGIYHHVKKANLPLLASWVLFGKFLLPRILFAAIAFTILFLGYLSFIYRFWNVDAFFVILFGVMICGFTWFEVFWYLKHRPF
jgi:hypothetical protein